MQTTVVYPGTFDPLTYGHLDVIQRAAKLFPKVYVAIASAYHKTPLFSLKERIELVEKSLSEFSNVVVVGFEGLLVEFMRAHHIRVIVRGVRVVSDFDYECQLANINRDMDPEIEQVTLHYTLFEKNPETMEKNREIPNIAAGANTTGGN